MAEIWVSKNHSLAVTLISGNLVAMENSNVDYVNIKPLSGVS